MNIVALFPGQGSQKVTMGEQFFNESPKAQELFERADKALGFSLTELCLRGPEDELMGTAISQPAILTVSVVAFQAFTEALGSGSLPNNDVNFVAAAGHSLGEYSALVAAGAMNFDDAVLLVHKRGRYMQEAVPRGHGGMLAVMGMEAEELESVCQECEGVVELANINAPGQIVVSGTTSGIKELQGRLEGKRVIELAVSAPFHSSLMKPAADALEKDLDALTIEKSSFPVYANVSATPVTEPDDIRASLKAQVCARVRWVESMEAMIRDAAPQLAIEFGEGKVLSGLLKRIDKGVPRANVSVPGDLLEGSPLGGLLSAS